MKQYSVLNKAIRLNPANHFLSMPVETISDVIYSTKGKVASHSIQQQKPGNGLFIKKFTLGNDKEVRNNRAVKTLINLVMAGTYVNTNISYPILIRATGSLPEAKNAHASLNNVGAILFTWTDNSGTGNANTNDKVILITYFPAIKKMIYTLHPSTRGKGSALLAMNTMRGYTAETWIGFVSDDEREAGNSVYTGRIIL